MRIVLTHVYCWPYVRRGSERHMDDVARYLHRRGHEVITVSTRPGRGLVEDTDGGRRILHREWSTPLMERLRLQPAHPFFLSAARGIVALKPDIVHSWSFTRSPGAWRPLTFVGRRSGVYPVFATLLAGYYRRFP